MSCFCAHVPQHVDGILHLRQPHGLLESRVPCHGGGSKLGDVRYEQGAEQMPSRCLLASRFSMKAFFLPSISCGSSTSIWLTVSCIRMAYSFISWPIKSSSVRPEMLLAAFNRSPCRRFDVQIGDVREVFCRRAVDLRRGGGLQDERVRENSHSRMDAISGLMGMRCSWYSVVMIVLVAPTGLLMKVMGSLLGGFPSRWWSMISRIDSARLLDRLALLVMVDHYQLDVGSP